MATTTSITTTYAGEFAGKYISAALLSGKTLAEGNITTVPNVKYKQVMKKVATDDIVKETLEATGKQLKWDSLHLTTYLLLSLTF